MFISYVPGTVLVNGNTKINTLIIGFQSLFSRKRAFKNKSMYKIPRPTHREGVKEEMMFKVGPEVINEFIRGKAFKTGKTLTEAQKNFTVFSYTRMSVKK